MKSLINTYNINDLQESDITDEYSELIEKVLNAAVKEVGFNHEFTVDISFCNNDYIRMVNKEYREIDKETDVLSFPIVNMTNGQIKDTEGDIDIEEGRILLGDILISKDMAAKQADEYGHSIDRETAFLALHGFLHLLGFDHELKEDEIIMFEKQEIILDKCGYRRGEN